MNNEYFNFKEFNIEELSLIKVDFIKIIESFLVFTLNNKNSDHVLIKNWDDFLLKQRMNENSLYLDQLFDFLSTTENLNILNTLLREYLGFEKIYKYKKHHKNNKKTSDILFFYKINEVIDELKFVKKDFFIKSFIIFYFIGIIETQAESDIIYLKSENEFNDFINQDLKYKFNRQDASNNLKWKLINCVEKSLTNEIFLIFTSQNKFYKIESLSTILIYFTSFLLHREFFKNNQKKIVKNKKTSYKTVYNYFIKNYSNNLPEFIFYLEFCKFEPIILKNKYINSKVLLNNTYLQFFDVVLKFQIINKTNPHYGSINENNERYDTEIKYNQNFDKMLKSSNSTKFFIDKKELKYLIKLFIENNLDKNASIFLEQSPENLIKYFKNYELIKSNQNKTLFLNILILIYLKKLELKISKQEFLYFPFYFDFRGRKYYNSLISPTNFVLIRFCIYFGNYTHSELNEICYKSLNTRSAQYLKKFIPEINKIKYLFKIFNKSNNSLIESDYIALTVINTLISIGFLFKSDILKTTNNLDLNYQISIEKFLEKGLSFLKNFSIEMQTSLDLEDKLKLNRYLLILEGEIDIYKKSPVPYDFSCSGHQLNFLYSKFKNIDDYGVINISKNDQYCDTYSYIIYIFKKNIRELYNLSENMIIENLYDDKLKTKMNTYFIPILKNSFSSLEELESVLKFFTRDHLKRSIMTTQYNASQSTFLIYPLSTFKTQDQIFFLKNKKKLFNILLKLFYFFCNNLNLFKNQLETLTTKEDFFNNFKKNNFKVHFFDGFEANLAYFPRSKYDSRLIFYIESGEQGFKDKISKKRITTKIISFSQIYSPNKTKISLNPNYIHSLDGGLVRLTTLALEHHFNETSCMTIHDEYWIPFQNSLIFKDLMNQLIKIKLNQNLNHDFIITYDYELIDDRLESAFNFFII